MKSRKSGYSAPDDLKVGVRIAFLAEAWSCTHRLPGQHHGPLTRTYSLVLDALLWGFHIQHPGRSFPSYEAIAANAQCNRSTALGAIHVLLAAGILVWDQSIQGRAGKPTTIPSSYRFLRVNPAIYLKPESRAGTLDEQSLRLPIGERLKTIALDPKNPLDAALIRLGRAGVLPC